jgi:excisionase family DNA binding protein
LRQRSPRVALALLRGSGSHRGCHQCPKKKANVMETAQDRPTNSIAATASSPALIDVRAVAKMLGCSPRHVYRLADAGKMPAPLKLGALVRWPKTAIEQWIAAGCPAVRRVSPRG